MEERVNPFLCFLFRMGSPPVCNERRMSRYRSEEDDQIPIDHLLFLLNN